MGNPEFRERLRAAAPWVLDGLLAVVMAAVGFALLASVLPFDPGSPPGAGGQAGRGRPRRPGVALVAAAVVLAIAGPWLPAKGVDVAVADPGLVLAWAGGRLVMARDLT